MVKSSQILGGTTDDRVYKKSMKAINDFKRTQFLVLNYTPSIAPL